MATNNEDVSIPGSNLEKALSMFWNTFLYGLWVGMNGFWHELFPRMVRYNYDALPKGKGQTAVITGGARGIGLQVIKKLLMLDYNVIFGVRNVDAGLKAINEIRLQGVQAGRAKCLQLDLKSLKSVRKFAENVLKETDRIDLLINNAGIMLEPYNITEDGYESQFQVNHLSHFLLTQLLLPKIKTTAARKNTNCRIVNVSSEAHQGSAASNFEDVHNPKVYNEHRAYFDSKMCQVLFTKYLNAQLKSEGANVNVYAIHPGVILTDLYAHVPGFVTSFLSIFNPRTTDGGSEVVMYAAIDPDLEGNGGHYIRNKKIGKSSSVADSLTLQKSLWDLSMKCSNKN